MAEFIGKVALVTGAGSGIGRATAELFAEMGAKVLVSDISQAGAQETVERIGRAGGEGAFACADVSQADGARGIVEAAIDRFGRLDYAFNNAGVNLMEEDGAWALDAFERTMAINAGGVFYCMKYELEAMLAQGGAGYAIVNTASVNGLVGSPQAGYVASKHAVVGLSRAAALKHARRGVRVNAVCPGVVETAMTAAAAADPGYKGDDGGDDAARPLGPPARDRRGGGLALLAQGQLRHGPRHGGRWRSGRVMAGRLEGNAAIVTGAAPGMGAATARLFAAEGAKVLLTDILEEAGGKTAGSIGVGAAFRRHDVTDEAQWRAVVDEAVERFRRLDILVNNAGVLHFSALLDTAAADFARVMAVNVTGVFLGVRTAGAVMARHGRGSIVNISSVDGFKATTVAARMSPANGRSAA